MSAYCSSVISSLFSVTTFECASSTSESSPRYSLITDAFCSMTERSGMTNITLFLLYFSAWARAYLSEERVLPPPVGTLSLQIPPRSSAEPLHISEIFLLAFSISVSHGSADTFSSTLSSSIFQSAPSFSSHFLPSIKQAVSVRSPSISAERISLVKRPI